jgi:hypothetical protein
MPPSETFMRNNQNYRQAGDWRFDRDSRYTGDGYRRSDGRKKIDARIKGGGKRMGGINEFHALQRGARAFSDPRFPGQSAGEIAQDMSSRGETTGFGGRGVTPDTGRPQTAQTGGSKGGFKRFRGPTDDQRKWSRKFQESQTPRTTSTPSGGGMLGAAARNFKRAVGAGAPASGPAPAPNFSRSALVQGAKKSGDFARVRDQYNTAAVGTGKRMDKMGNITPLSKQASGPEGTSAFARDKFGAAAEDIRARRDFATGKSTVTSGTAGLFADPSDPFPDQRASNSPRPVQSSDFSRTITSKYGGGTNVSRAPGQGGGTMADPLTGKRVPMKDYLAQQSAVQGTKEPGNTSGAGSYDPKKIRSSMQKGKA